MHRSNLARTSGEILDGNPVEHLEDFLKEILEEFLQILPKGFPKGTPGCIPEETPQKNSWRAPRGRIPKKKTSGRIPERTGGEISDGADVSIYVSTSGRIAEKLLEEYLKEFFEEFLKKLLDEFLISWRNFCRNSLRDSWKISLTNP